MAGGGLPHGCPNATTGHAVAPTECNQSRLAAYAISSAAVKVSRRRPSQTFPQRRGRPLETSKGRKAERVARPNTCPFPRFECPCVKATAGSQGAAQGARSVLAPTPVPGGSLSFVLEKPMLVTYSG
jgi:hypothetical protein